eukprot:TRINITY_DN73226_c0_g1_i1.p1 TRINITY_DN73226_c0_g1~~TRINITY_DN73226_c0_g1_i1.p1  ORF type:complete len:1052 (+),score=158.68 TRINITY_DN73226_c0_g1_i1:47-3157(+)
MASSSSSSSRRASIVRLFPRDHQRDNCDRLSVTVLRATNLKLPAMCWQPPQVVLTLGNQERRSPVGQAYGSHPIFDWRVELPWQEGRASHLIFEVISGEDELGTCMLPMTSVLRQAGEFHKALPLLRNGRVPGATTGDERSELLVMVSLTEDDFTASAVQQKKAAALRRRCSQLRLALRSLRLSGDIALEGDSPKLNPYVKASMLPQQARTATAHCLADNDAEEEFVFAQHIEGLDCGDVLRGRTDRYEKAGQTRRQGYRMFVDGGDLKVTYRDVDFVFWLQQEDMMHVAVFDDVFMYQDPQVAFAVVQLSYIFELAFDENGQPKESQGRTRTVLLNLPLSPYTTHAVGDDLEGADGSTGGSSSTFNAVGAIELEVEFLEDPVASPCFFEGRCRSARSAQMELADFREASLQLLANSAASNRPQLPRPIGDFSVELRHALAKVCTASAVATMRRLADPLDENVPLLRSRLLSLVVQICDTLVGEAEPLLREELLASAEAASSSLGLEEAVDEYCDVCPPPTSDHKFERLLPFCSVWSEFQRRGWGGALLRAALRRASDIVQPAKGGDFFELVERHLVASGQIAVPQEMTLGMEGCLSGLEVAMGARELAAGEGSGTIYERREQAQLARRSLESFLPSIDMARLVQGDGRVDEADNQIVPGSFPGVLAGTLGLAAFAGYISALAYTKTAHIIHTMDTEFLCNPRYAHVPLTRTGCEAMMSSNLDELLEKEINSPAGFRLFFAVFSCANGYSAWNLLNNRCLLVRELSLEPLGPPLSPHLVICASGFLRNLADICQPWMVDPSSPWTAGQVVFLRFATDVLVPFGRMLSDTFTRQMKQTEAMIYWTLAVSNPISLSQTAIAALLEELGDMIDVASNRADQVGRKLAHQLLAFAEAAAGAPRPVSLIGFSTGALMVHSCLQELRLLADAGRNLASDLVCDVVLLGAPVSAANTKEWALLRQLVSGRFVNGFYSEDAILVSHAWRRGIKRHAGTSAVLASDVENIGMEQFIQYHHEYAINMQAILGHIFGNHGVHGISVS